MDAVPQAELIALQRSAAMVGGGQSVPVPADVLGALCTELLANRSLLERFGADLRTIARRPQ
jgi:hypothetical protein